MNKHIQELILEAKDKIGASEIFFTEKKYSYTTEFTIKDKYFKIGLEKEVKNDEEKGRFNTSSI